MKRKHIIITAAAILTLILLFPLPVRLKDGGSIEFRSIVNIYSVTKLRRAVPAEDGEVFKRGVEMRVFGIKIFEYSKVPAKVPAPDISEPGLEPGLAFAWEPPSPENSTQLELPAFPGTVFSNEYNKVPNEYGGFSWDIFVKAASRDGVKKLFDFGTGPNSVFIADITGDGYPDFAYMVSWTSGLFTLGVKVYDYVNDMHYALGGYGSANGLVLENDRLMVARYNDEGNLAPIGTLVMADGALAVAGVEKQDDFTDPAPAIAYAAP